jgi:hypothetical protein
VRTPDGRIQIGDVSNAGPVGTVKRGDKDVRVWTAIWYDVASDGTDWHNALRTGYLTGPIAARVAALSLHHFDISFCQRILTEYQLKFVNEYNDASLALWIAVITKFMSCFQNSKGRPQIYTEKVYRGNPTALHDSELLMHLRNKHVVHDQNSHHNAAAFAWLEPNGCSPGGADAQRRSHRSDTCHGDVQSCWSRTGLYCHCDGRCWKGSSETRASNDLRRADGVTNRGLFSFAD